MHEPQSKRPRWLLVLLSFMLFYQLGAVIQALRIPASAAADLNLSPAIQLVTGVTWVMLFGWGIMGLIREKSVRINRALWLVFVFILYSMLRLWLFAQAEYDRQRMPFLLVLVMFLVIILIVMRFVWGRTHNRTLNGE